jgi:hypothetical protein
MFQKLAKFRLVRSLGMAPGRRAAIPANDNLPGGFRPNGSPSRQPRQNRPRPLTCHWSLIGTQLVCRWQSAAAAPATAEDPEPEAMTFRRRGGVSHNRLRNVLSGTAIA